METKQDIYEVEVVEGEIVEGEESVVEPQYSEDVTEVVEVIEEAASVECEEEYDIQKEIEEKVNIEGIAYVYDGKVLDESKLSVIGKQYAIFNQITGLPFIYNGGVVKYNNRKEADAALITLSMYTGNDKLTLLDYSQLIGHSLL